MSSQMILARDMEGTKDDMGQSLTGLPDSVAHIETRVASTAKSPWPIFGGGKPPPWFLLPAFLTVESSRR
jgi:hypothetical protein